MGDIPHVAHRAQPRADAAVEGRAARRRLPGVVVGREDRLRGGGCRHRGQRRHARGHPAVATRRSTPTGSRWCTTASTPSCGGAERDEDVVRRHGVDPDRPSVIFVGRITRQKGLPYLLRAAAAAAARGAARAARRRPRHPGDQGRGRGPHRHPARDPRRRRLGADDAAAQRGRGDAAAAPPCSSARRSTSRSASSTSRRWPASCRWSPRRPAASPRSSSHGETGWLVPIDQVQDGTGTPVDPDRFVADLAAALTDAVSDTARAHAGSEPPSRLTRPLKARQREGWR